MGSWALPGGWTGDHSKGAHDRDPTWMPCHLVHREAVQCLLMYLLIPVFLGLLFNQDNFPLSYPSKSPELHQSEAFGLVLAAFLLLYSIIHPSAVVLGPFAEDYLL